MKDAIPIVDPSSPDQAAPAPSAEAVAVQTEQERQQAEAAKQKEDETWLSQTFDRGTGETGRFVDFMLDTNGDEMLGDGTRPPDYEGLRKLHETFKKVDKLGKDLIDLVLAQAKDEKLGKSIEAAAKDQAGLTEYIQKAVGKAIKEGGYERVLNLAERVETWKEQRKVIKEREVELQKRLKGRPIGQVYEDLEGRVEEGREKLAAEQETLQQHQERGFLAKTAELFSKTKRERRKEEIKGVQGRIVKLQEGINQVEKVIETIEQLDAERDDAFARLRSIRREIGQDFSEVQLLFDRVDESIDTYYSPASMETWNDVGDLAAAYEVAEDAKFGETSNISIGEGVAMKSSIMGVLEGTVTRAIEASLAEAAKLGKQSEVAKVVTKMVQDLKRNTTLAQEAIPVVKRLFAEKMDEYAGRASRDDRIRFMFLKAAQANCLAQLATS